MHQKFLFCVAVTTLLSGCSTTSSDSRPSIDGVAEATEGYISDNNGNVLVSGDGTCFRSSVWSEANQVGACEIIDEAIALNIETKAAVVENNSASENVAPSAVPAEPTVATVEQIVLNSSFLFQFDADQFSSESDAEMDAIITKLSSFQNIQSIDVVGHTDDRGPVAYNQGLSEKRATAVKNKLEQVFPQIPISASGLGETAPVASNKTAEGRQQNRRVEIRMVATDE